MSIFEDLDKKIKNDEEFRKETTEDITRALQENYKTQKETMCEGIITNRKNAILIRTIHGVLVDQMDQIDMQAVEINEMKKVIGNDVTNESFVKYLADRNNEIINTPVNTKNLRLLEILKKKHSNIINNSINKSVKNDVNKISKK